MLLGLPLLAAVTLASQGQDPPPPQPPVPAPAGRVMATRAAQPPVIDGRDDDAVWREAQPISGFQEWRPSEGVRPSSRPRRKSPTTRPTCTSSSAPSIRTPT